MKIEEVFEIVKLAARRCSRNDSTVEFDDLVSQSMEKYLAQKGKIVSADHGGNPRGFLNKLVENVARDMRAKTLYDSPQYTYRADDVKRILTHVLARSEIINRDDLGEEFTINDLPDIRADITSCLALLPEPDQRSIICRYYFGEMPGNDTAARKRLDRAIMRLVVCMNSYVSDREFVGSRRVIKNSHAAALIGKLEN